MQLSLATSSAIVTRRVGAEGPSYDPYHFAEFTVRLKAGGAPLVLHIGLAAWLEEGKRRVDLPDDATIRGAMRLFHELVGFSPDDFDRYYQRVHSRCRSCGSRGPFREESGHPGETFSICGCGNVTDACFDRSAIE